MLGKKGSFDFLKPATLTKRQVGFSPKHCYVRVLTSQVCSGTEQEIRESLQLNLVSRELSYEASYDNFFVDSLASIS